MLARIYLFLLLQTALLIGAEVDSVKNAPRPEDGIYDPAGIISPAKRIAISREISNIRSSSGLDMLVAVTQENTNQEPTSIATDLANQWGYHAGRGLILWIPGDERSPWISVSGLIRSELPTASIDSYISLAETEGRKEKDVAQGIESAVKSLGENLRFATAMKSRQVTTEQQSFVITTKAAIFTLARNSKKIVLFSVAALVIFGFIGYWCVRFWQWLIIRIVPKTFPEVAWKRRFGAPHGGIVYTRSRKKTSRNE